MSERARSFEKEAGGLPDHPPAGTPMPTPGGKPFDPPTGGKKDDPPPSPPPDFPIKGR